MCVFKNNVENSRTLWLTVLLDAGKGQPLNLEPLVKFYFPFHTAFVPSSLALSPGISMGMVPVSLPFAGP